MPTTAQEHHSDPYRGEHGRERRQDDARDRDVRGSAVFLFCTQERDCHVARLELFVGELRRGVDRAIDKIFTGRFFAHRLSTLF